MTALIGLFSVLLLYNNLIIEGADKTVTIVYDLAGRRLQKPEKGLNIVNGQKIILKK